MNKKYINGYNWGDSIVLEYKENNTKKSEVIEHFKWYLVITIQDYNRIKHVEQKLKDVKLIDEVEIVGEFVKLYTLNLNSKYKQDGKQALIEWLTTNGIEPLESDIDSCKRYCLDNNIEIDDQYNILYFDIETDDTNLIIDIGNDRILSMAAMDRNGNEYYLENRRSEKQLIQSIIDLLKRYDVIVSWNGEKFDLPYIVERAKKYNLKYYELYRIAHVDMLKRFRHIFRFDNGITKFSLQYISEHFLGTSKIDHKGIKIIELYKKFPEKLKEYNIQDVKLLLDLDNKVGCLNMMIIQCQWCKTFIKNFYISELLDNYILKIAHSKGTYCPSRHEVEDKTKYEGAYVLEPDRGVHDNVFIFDFKSLYPTLIMTSNIGFDTLSEEGEIINPGTRKRFKNDKSSIIKETVQGLIGKRKEYKKKKLEMIKSGTNSGPEWERVVSDEIVVKELSNSVYGIMGKQDGRWYSLDVATSITIFGQWAIKFATKFFNDRGFKVIYGDTDSTFVKDNDNEDLQKSMDKYLKEFHIELEKTLKNEYNIIENFIELEVEKKYGTIILIDKKTYTGRLSMIEGNKTNQMYTRGVDYIKSNNIKIAAESQLKLIKNILYKDKYTVDESEKFINDKLEIVRSGKLDLENLIIQVRLGRPIDTYTTNLPHVLVARRMIKENGMLQSNEIEYIVQDAKTKQYILPDEFNGEYDRLYYWNNKIYPLLKRILEIVYPNNNWDKFKFKHFEHPDQQSLNL